MAITTAMCSSFKGDILSGLHCFNATITKAGDTHTSVTLDGLANVTGLAVGMAVSGSGIAANTVIARILSSTSVELSKAATATASAVTITFTGDVFKAALIKDSPAGTYGAATTNYTDVTGNSDEVPNGSGYTTGGVTLTNVSPVVSGTVGFIDFTPDPSWSSATFSAAGFIIYNSTQRGPLATRATSVYDFGGNQSVSNGTFTIVMPTADSSNAVLRIQ